MSKWIKVLATKLDDLSSSPRTHKSTDLFNYPLIYWHVPLPIPTK